MNRKEKLLLTLPYPLGLRHRWEVSTLPERLREWAMPGVCAVLGHQDESKMYDIICRRCRIVLRPNLGPDR